MASMRRAVVLALLLSQGFAAPDGGVHGVAVSFEAKMLDLEVAFRNFEEESRRELDRLAEEGRSRRLELAERITRLQEEEVEELAQEGEELMPADRRLSNETSAWESVTSSLKAHAETISDLQSAMDHTWMLICGALVMFMQAGFAMVEAGCCRSKNVQNILMKNMVDVCVGTVCWWAFGWAIAYGKGDGENGPFMNYNQWFGTGFTPVTDDGNFSPSDSNYMLNWFFQWAFCSAGATIVSGGVAERVQFPGYLIYTFMMTSFIYPVVAHWTWGGGWLAGGSDYSINETGFMDFAGSGIVHLCGGVGALVGAAIIGPRKGRFDEDGEENFDPHSLPLIVLGTFILWFGWYGFNCGSTLAMTTKAHGTLAAQVAMNTTLSAATGGLSLLVLRFIFFRKYDIGGMCNGILSGLVAITAGCGNVECGTAVLIGLIGAILYQGASSLLQRLKIDDPIDAFAVHGVNGAWGTLAAVLFDFGKGVDYFNGWSGWECVGGKGSCRSGAFGEALVANVLQIVTITLWTAVLSLIIFGSLMKAGLLRAADTTQDLGMDAAKHSPAKAYS